MEDKRKYWLWLSHVTGQGSKTAVSLVRHYGEAYNIYNTATDEFKKDGVVKDNVALSRLSRRDLSEEEEILYWCDNNGVGVLNPYDEKYPKSLLSLRDAPMVLYYVGELPDFDETFCCAVVGTRKMSDYGKKMAYDIGTGLADSGAVLVSGLALGIDGMAMAGAIEAGGKTIAVLGCGIDVVYPKEHERLLAKVAETGTVITEYAPGVSPTGSHFPVRNRIISGISQATCVIEGNMKSGSLITARHALYQGKDLYAVPGRVGDDGSQGTNYLLKQGAHVTTCSDDIIENYDFVYPLTLRILPRIPHIPADEAADNMDLGKREKTKKKGKRKSVQKNENPFSEIQEPVKSVNIDYDSFSDDEKKIYDFMTPDVPMLTEEIAKCGLAIKDVIASLTMLEISGAIEAGSGGYYLKRASDSIGSPDFITEDDNGL